MKFHYPNAVSGESMLWVVAQVSVDSGEAVPGNVLLTYRPGAPIGGYPTDWTIIDLVQTPDVGVIALGLQGDIMQILGENREDMRLYCDEPPLSRHGPLRGLACLHGEIFAFGMGRQILQRQPDGLWRHAAMHLLDDLRDYTTGINAMCESPGQGIVAVGFGGDILESNGGWQQIDSPTNVLLNCVHAWGGTIWAGGIMGTLLRRDANGWQVVDMGDFNHDIWDICDFEGQLYLGTTNGLFVFDGDGPVPVTQAGIAEQIVCSRLVRHEDKLFVLGGGEVRATSDGVAWALVEML